MPTPTDCPPVPLSVYALTKQQQEDYRRHAVQTSGLPLVVLRYFNVYGSQQSLRNPYTGVISIFCSLLREGRALSMYEGGPLIRDFVHVDDVVQANLLALDPRLTRRRHLQRRHRAGDDDRRHRACRGPRARRRGTTRGPRRIPRRRHLRLLRRTRAFARRARLRAARHARTGHGRVRRLGRRPGVGEPLRAHRRRTEGPRAVRPGPARESAAAGRMTRRILFVAEAASIAHVARPSVLAATLDASRHEIHFASSGEFAFCHEGQPWRFHRLAGLDPAEFLARLSSGRPVFSASDLERRVDEDLRLLAEVEPDVVVHDFRPHARRVGPRRRRSAAQHLQRALEPVLGGRRRCRFPTCR
ncbi:MAG: NAD-dependent epimerase/dehydratase family protein [Comamonadaceae bacterium]|nr:NAD-dependent epimerase/dehydratase family protein [Comamonadaceae bacterium]